MTEIPQTRPSMLVAALLMGALAATAGGQTPMNERILFGFDSPDALNSWTPVNDTVMGGVSSGGCRVTAAGTLEFSGKVSLENNGGFASIRARMDSLNLSGYDELVIRVRGDGKRYALSVQTDYPIMAGAYYFSFASKSGEWREIRAPMSAFEPRSFGRPLPRAPALNASSIRSMGFMISDKQEGLFRLEVDWIKAARSAEGQSLQEWPGEQNKVQAATVLIKKAIDRGAPLFNAGQPRTCAEIYEFAAGCIVDLWAVDLPAGVVEALRYGLASAEQTTDPVKRAWALRNAFDASLRILGQEDLEKGVTDG